MCVVGVRSLLNDLLERRHQYHLENNRACEKLSKIEVDILCLLLEVNSLNFFLFLVYIFCKIIFCIHYAKFIKNKT